MKEGRKLTLNSFLLLKREQLASKLLGIGKGVAGGQAVKRGQQPQQPTSSNAVSDGKYAQDAIKWIQKALSLVENLAASETPGILELKVSKPMLLILKSSL